MGATAVAKELLKWAAEVRLSDLSLSLLEGLNRTIGRISGAQVDGSCSQTQGPCSLSSSSLRQITNSRQGYFLPAPQSIGNTAAYRDESWRPVTAGHQPPRDTLHRCVGPYNLTWAAAWTVVRNLVGSMQCGCFHPPTSFTSLNSTSLPAAFRSGRSEPSRFGSATRSSPPGCTLALGLTCLGAWLVSRHSKFRFIEISLAIAVLGNVAMHVVASVLTWTYSPGLVSGVLIWVPLGTVRLRSARRTSTPRGYVAGVYLGLSVVLITMAVVAVGGFTSL